MSRKMIQGADQKIQDAKELLRRVEAKAVRVREAIATLEVERRESEPSNAATRN
jgi:PP-loop superfamily ATP-utilizing enzyme